LANPSAISSPAGYCPGASIRPVIPLKRTYRRKKNRLLGEILAILIISIELFLYIPHNKKHYSRQTWQWQPLNGTILAVLNDKFWYMKRIFLLFAIISLFFAQFAVAQEAEDWEVSEIIYEETIDRYDVHITVQQDGTFLVEEKIL